MLGYSQNSRDPRNILWLSEIKWKGVRSAWVVFYLTLNCPLLAEATLWFWHQCPVLPELCWTPMPSSNGKCHDPQGLVLLMVWIFWVRSYTYHTQSVFPGHTCFAEWLKKPPITKSCAPLHNLSLKSALNHCSSWFAWFLLVTAIIKATAFTAPQWVVSLLSGQVEEELSC